MRILISAGHGPNTPGKRAPDGFREFHFTYPTAEFTAQYFDEYEGVQVLKAYEPGRDVPLQERTKKANSWGANLYISIHGNAHGSGTEWTTAHGIETLVYSTSTSPSNGYNVGTRVQEELIRATGLTNRGVKVRADLWEIKATNMPAILMECGFYTNQAEKALMASAAYQQKCARAIVTGVATHYGLKKKANAPVPVPAPSPSPKPEPAGTIYRVQIGAFANKANADALEKEAKSKGIEAFIYRDAGLYKVQVGAFKNLGNAKKHLAAVKKHFTNAFIT